MAEHLAQCFVDLRCLSLAAERVTKLRLDHVKRGFDVALVLTHAQLRSSANFFNQRFQFPYMLS
jgi:hypothetical protein